MIKLVWRRKSDRFTGGVVIGDPESIRDLYWQLTHNYSAKDGTEIGEITISDLDGYEITNIMSNPYESNTCGKFNG